jgi:hypothetical protein
MQAVSNHDYNVTGGVRSSLINAMTDHGSAS